MVRRQFVLSLLVLSATCAAALASGFIVVSTIRADEQPEWAANVPEQLPWGLTHVVTEDGVTIELDRPASVKAEIVAAILEAQGKAGSSSPAASAHSDDRANESYVPVTCAYGTGWNLISTFTAQFGTIFVCSAPIGKTATDRFGYVDPVYYEFVQSDSYGPHYNSQATWYHLKNTSIDPADLNWCAYGSGWVYFNTPQFWTGAYCDWY